MRCFLVAMLVVSSLFAQPNVQRPHILGLAHVAFRVTDMSKTSSFYENLLGYAEPFSLSGGNGKPTIGFVKVNDDQYVELFQGDARNRGQLDHFAMYTDDLAAMREYLLSQHVQILEDIHEGRIGNPFLTVRDPDGHHIEILQYSQESSTARSQGKFMPASRVSSHITHVGILVGSTGRAIKYYRDVLGFREVSRGGGDGQPSWVDLQAPDGSDYVELLFFAGVSSPASLRAQNHFCLESSDVRETVARLQTWASGLLTSPITVQTGSNLPTRADFSDPDGARIEIMEPMEPVSAAASRTAMSHP